MPKEIPPDAVPASKAVLAAGAVLWRPNGDPAAPEVAIIHRPRYDDWSLPKGKVDPGETEPVTAVREVAGGDRLHVAPRQATRRRQLSGGAGHQEGAVLGGALSRRRLQLPTPKSTSSIWLPVAEAMKQLEYPHDRKVLRHFAKQPVDTQTVLIVRHGTAGSKSRYKGDDRKRPLDKHGRAQAESLVGQLLAFGANELYAADRVRCHQTLEPLAEEIGVTIHNEPALTEEAYAGRTARPPGTASSRSPQPVARR